ncbi:hypothetical protein ACWDLG_30505 [Nonomuraea sp. NPDC003727]
MADHDRAAGPRGEEEAPRGPDPESAPPPASGASQAGPPPPPSPPPPPRETFAGFVRQKHAQIIGAGLIGLLAGGVLGGAAVAILFRVADHGDRPRTARWEDHGRHRFGGPESYRLDGPEGHRLGGPEVYRWGGPEGYRGEPPAECWFTPRGRTCTYPYARPPLPSPMPTTSVTVVPPPTVVPTVKPTPTG